MKNVFQLFKWNNAKGNGFPVGILSLEEGPENGLLT